MPISFTAAFQEAVAMADSNVTFIETMTISHSLFPAPFRIARSDVDFVNGPDTYKGGQFSIKLPEMSAGTTGGIQISVSDVDFAIAELLDSVIETLEPIEVLYQVFMSTETGPQADFQQNLEATNILMSGRDLSLTANYPDLINKKVPARKFDTTDFPGLR